MAGHSIASCLLEHTPRAGSPSAIPAGLGCSCGCSPRSGRPAQHFLCKTPHSASAAVRGISSTFASLTGRLAKISKIPAGLEFLLISDDTADKNLWLIFSSKECFSFEKTLLPSASRSDSCNMYFCSFQMPLYQIHHCPAPSFSSSCLHSRVLPEGTQPEVLAAPSAAPCIHSKIWHTTMFLCIAGPCCLLVWLLKSPPDPMGRCCAPAAQHWGCMGSCPPARAQLQEKTVPEQTLLSQLSTPWRDLGSKAGTRLQGTFSSHSVNPIC